MTNSKTINYYFPIEDQGYLDSLEQDLDPSSLCLSYINDEWHSDYCVFGGISMAKVLCRCNLLGKISIKDEIIGIYDSSILKSSLQNMSTMLDSNFYSTKVAFLIYITILLFLLYLYWSNSLDNYQIMKDVAA